MSAATLLGPNLVTPKTFPIVPALGTGVQHVCTTVRNITYDDKVVLLVKVFSVDRPPLGVNGRVVVVGEGCDKEREEPGASCRHTSHSPTRCCRDCHLQGKSGSSAVWD